ncbi:hypothetical protein ACGF3G_48665 [Streptomyces sp. NPDC048179]
MHEQVVRHEVVAGLLADEPRLEADVVIGGSVPPAVWRIGRPVGC